MLPFRDEVLQRIGGRRGGVRRLLVEFAKSHHRDRQRRTHPQDMGRRGRRLGEAQQAQAGRGGVAELVPLGQFERGGGRSCRGGPLGGELLMQSVRGRPHRVGQSCHRVGNGTGPRHPLDVFDERRQTLHLAASGAGDDAQPREIRSAGHRVQCRGGSHALEIAPSTVPAADQPRELGDQTVTAHRGGPVEDADDPVIAIEFGEAAVGVDVGQKPPGTEEFADPLDPLLHQVRYQCLDHRGRHALFSGERGHPTPP